MVGKVIHVLKEPTLKILSKYSISLCIGALCIVGCSRKNDSFINRNWHAVGTEFNVLYNGNLALENGRKSLNEGYTDNYWEILPIERMQVEEEITLPGQSKNRDSRADRSSVDERSAPDR